MSLNGKVHALSTSRKKGVPKKNQESVKLVEDWGIEGDAHGGPGHRQVSLLALESIDKMRAKGVQVRPGAFAENITTEEVGLQQVQLGDRVHVGASELEITQLGKECHEPCAIYHQVGDCVMPREGVFARVLRGGEVKIGDAVRIEKK